MSRKERSIKKVFKVFCEGDTEYNYFDNIRTTKNISLAIRPVNMGGGGYANFISKLKCDSNSNCIAKFIVVDGDKALTDSSEQKRLDELIQYCRIQNNSKRIPHILIVDFPDFEYVACLHFENYNGKNSEQFITDELKYKSISDFKSDKKVLINIEKKGGSFNNLLKAINRNNVIVDNEISVKKKIYEITVGKTEYYSQNIGKKGTNINDFFDVLDKLGILI